MNITFHCAKRKDLSAIVQIYNSTVASGVVTADNKPVTIQSKIEWFRQHNILNRPLLVIKNDNNDIIGWVSFRSFYGRPAYNATAEVSIYLHEKARGKGIGKQALQYSIDLAPKLGVKTLLGFIFKENEPSISLFKNAGFKVWGNLPHIAEIEGSPRSLIIMGLRVMK